ncbi:Nucleotide-diphospho-sugar transferase [Parasponia andersonii]|uniref:Nucleotide-diphospho-sugar transferase n=1 Tax=Parasponia andersonii TaxID=3476 RepID=A0A2P5CJV0_PARAD|nr:Nucleotide-diphospho-sugar transferase [Parasponia andersonii]
MDDNTVIVTIIVDEAWTNPGSVLDLFLESFRLGQGTKSLLNYLLIVTVGSKAFQRCKSVHPHCYQLTRLGSRNKLLLDMLKLGYNFVFTEADVMWFRTPLPEIHPLKQITIPCDLASAESKRERNRPGRGLFSVRSSDISIQLFRYWMVLGVLDHTFQVESLCENIKDQQEYIKMLEVQISYLDTTYFGGFCKEAKRDMNKVYTLQANCCDDVENKVYDLRLVLEGWRNFTAQTSNFSSGLVPSERAPTKCIV